MSVKTEISPLNVGDVALRVRVAFAGSPARPVVVNTEAVRVVAVSPTGEWVTWTNCKKSRTGGEYRHTSARRELLNLDALAEQLSPTTAPLPKLAASEVNPAAAA